MRTKGFISAWASALPAALLAVWYLLAVTGLDVHADSEHGRTYVVSSVSGGDCEHIHPEYHCHDGEASEGECLAGEECCSDVFSAVLSLTDREDSADSDFVVPFVEIPCFWGMAALVPGRTALSVLHGVSPPPDPGRYLSKLSVLRA